jgi:hypothetical protein
MAQPRYKINSWWCATKLRDLQLRGDSWDSANPKNAPSLFIGIGESTGKPAINIYLNDGSPDDKNLLRVQLNNMDLQTIFLLIEEAIASTTVYNENYEVNTIFKGSEVLSSPVKVATIHVIRTPEGVIKLAVRSNSKKPVFTFKTPYPNAVKDGTGELVDAGRSSPLAAQAWVNIFKALVTNILADIPEPVKNESGGNGYNNYGNRGGNNNNNNRGNDNSGYRPPSPPPTETVTDDDWQPYNVE